MDSNDYEEDMLASCLAVIKEHPSGALFSGGNGEYVGGSSDHLVSHDIMTLADLTSRAVEYVYYLQRMWAL
ncbi:hypothetical protein JCM10914A_18950 [Paenibacillus sp. JCM 10914]|nr:hypothetical protein JCM10914_2379 [Paenibacillus sp. JCM 10914]